jgi:hypothetical protein
MASQSARYLIFDSHQNLLSSAGMSTLIHLCVEDGSLQSIVVNSDPTSHAIVGIQFARFAVFHLLSC